jgi:ferric-dicitrate binding protein FerR (iron transport regulator)
MDTQVIYKVLSGTATGDEARAVSDWIARSRENQEEYNSLRLLWMSGNFTVTDRSSKSEGFFAIRNFIEEQIKKNTRQKQRKTVAIFLSAVIIAMVPVIIINSRHEAAKSYIRFEQTSFESVIRSMEANYNVKIEVERPDLLTCQFTGTFYKVDGTDDVMQSLANAMNLKCEELSDNVYKLSGLGCVRS